MRRVDRARGNKRRGILSCHIDLSLAGRDMLLCFVPRSPLMGNNVTMIRAIIPLLSSFSEE